MTTVGDGGFPVGLWPDMTYEETTTKLAPGDRLVLYSDGVMECVNPDGVNYSVEQLQQLLTRKINDPVKEVLQAIQADLEGWSHGRGFPDDISLLIIESK